MEFIFRNLDLLLFLGLVVTGFVAGSINERRHYSSIIQRERESLGFQVVTAEAYFPDGVVRESFLVSGSVVVSIDYFKRILGNLRNIFGGRVRAYESLLDRARREALLRMKVQAMERGAAMVTNYRLETSTLSGAANQKGQVASIEVIAYGTAVICNRP